MNVMKFADIELPSNRKFGYFCMFIFGVGGIYLYDGVMTNILYMLSALFGATLVCSESGCAKNLNLSKMFFAHKYL